MSRAGISPSADLPFTTGLRSSESSADSRASGAGRPRAVRWIRWLVAGIAFGLLTGFLAGLSRPQRDTTGPDFGSDTNRPPRTETASGTDSSSGTGPADGGGE